MYGHCIKQFSYFGEYIRSIGECGKATNGSAIVPLQFDRVTDIARNSKGFYYISDGDIGGLNNRVAMLNQTLDLVQVWGKLNKAGPFPLQFNLPHGIAVDQCDRVWIIDTQNHRIQVVSENGEFLGEWRCFGEALIYGFDFAATQAGHSDSSVVVTTKTDNGPEVLTLLFKNNCSELNNFGKCEIIKRMVPSWREAQEINEERSVDSNSMLHSVTFDNVSNTFYLTELPGSSPPLKLNVAGLPPESDLSTCEAFPAPPALPEKWSAKVLLTPFTDSELVVGSAEYSSSHKAMYFRLYHPAQGVSEIYVHNKETYHLRSRRGKTVCAGPYNLGWAFPSRDWIQTRPCKCQGSLDVSGVHTVFWRCPIFQFVDWFWFHRDSSRLWRIIMNNDTNPNGLPVFGEYAMIHFTSYGDDTLQLEKAAKLCNGTSRDLEMLEPAMAAKKFLLMSFQNKVKGDDEATPISGFSYKRCERVSEQGLPKWPEHFYLTSTMYPVDDKAPFPTQVLYDWSRKSQHTRMHLGHAIYDTYLIGHNTYILTRFPNGRLNCTGHLKFGPPRPNWMNEDKCKCMGHIQENPDFSPWHNTTIAVCPLMEGRVFWAWFSDDHAGYTPVMFYETDSPLGEGTNLALADYHFFHSNHLLTDVNQFKVPAECV